MPGRWACGALQISIVQSAGRLSASSTARSSIAMAVLIGADSELVLARPLHPHGAAGHAQWR